MAKKEKRVKEKRVKKEKPKNELFDLPWRKIFGGIGLFAFTSYRLLTYANQKSVAYDTRPEFHKGAYVNSIEKESDFSSSIENRELSLVKFYAPWCGHCKAMAPQWAQAAEQLKDNDRVDFLGVDCTLAGNQGVCKKYNVTGYPTIKGFKFGKEFEDDKLSNDARQAPSAIKFVHNQLEIDTIQDLTGAQYGQSDNYIVGVFSSKEEENFENFKTWASDEKENIHTIYNVGFEISADAETANSVNIIKNGQTVATYEDDDFSAEKLTEFLQENYYKSETQASYIFSSELANLGYPNFLILADDPSQYQDLANALVASNPNNARKVAIGERDNFMNLINQYNLKKTLGSKLPTVLGMDNKSEAFICDISAGLFGSPQGSIKKCYSDIEAGKLQMWMKSEEIPTGDEKYENWVQKVVAKNIKEVVFDESKDVLLEIYAPWCGHCKKLAPEYEKLAEEVAAKTDKVVIAKVDGTLNSMPESLSYTGFPTLYWVPAGSNQPVTPQGRDYNSLLKWVVENASVEVDIEIPIKSEEVPAENQAGEVVQLVGKNFKKIINGEKNALVKFYAPWCGHCKAMAPAYIELAEDLKDQFDDVIVAEVDATANDTPSGFAYTGFPTMFWVPKGSTEPIKYDSGRDKASMKAYIEEKLSANADSHDEL